MIKEPANLQQVKENNRGLIFSLIHEHGKLSRSGLTGITHLSPTTVSSLVDELIGLGLVEECGPAETSGSGRKPILLSVRPDGGFFASAELTYDGFELALYDMVSEDLGWSKVKLTNYGTIGRDLVGAIKALSLDCMLEPQRLKGICIGAPAVIDPEHEIIIVSTVLPIKPGTDFMADIRDSFPGVPARLENESGLCCYAELIYGSLSGLRDLLYVDIDIGIGSGLILDGRLYRGSTGQAGEIGHVSIDYEGPTCPCGNKGCLELMANVPALLRRVVGGMGTSTTSIIHSLTGGDPTKVNLESIRLAADQGDSFVLSAIDETALLLSSGINSVLNVLNPQAVVIGGKMAELGQVLFDRIELHLARMALKPASRDRHVYRSAIAGNAATLGGARLLLDDYLRRF